MRDAKTLRIVLALLILACPKAFAQKATQDLELSYGFAPPPLVAASFWNMIFGGGSTKAVGPIGLEYTYQLGGRTAVGVSGSYAEITYQKTSSTTSSSRLKNQAKYVTLLPQFQVYLGRKDKLETYSAISLGISYEHFTSTHDHEATSKEWLPAYHVTGIGVRTKAKTAF
ncbi:MAG: hypothetical protein LPK14_14945, partial [Hymenobacteraceae bacterium]|nr:hypothetical protein [Hymenobacteraceae bacterium]